jgi:hypothetical protein
LGLNSDSLSRRGIDARAYPRNGQAQLYFPIFSGNAVAHPSFKLTAEWRIKDDGHLIRLALDPLKTNASPKA